jgi:hypothetical protein
MSESQMFGNPFPGLRSFQMDGSHLFFGRERHTEELLQKLRTTRFVSVVGASGTGKSSLVRAGLLPALLGGFLDNGAGAWRLALFRPGIEPIRNLARALSSANGAASPPAEERVDVLARTEATLDHSSLGLINYVRQSGLTGKESLLVVVDQFEEVFRWRGITGDSDYLDHAAEFVKFVALCFRGLWSAEAGVTGAGESGTADASSHCCKRRGRPGAAKS